jgi:heat-inducible transcriptional repressor
MPPSEQLSERELRVLEAVVQTYIETAEPAGSQTIARKFGLGVSPATIRNTMSELEEKGYLFHPHTSAGRIPTDRAYRIYVDAIMRLSPPSHLEQNTLRAELVGTRCSEYSPRSSGWPSPQRWTRWSWSGWSWCR